MHKYLIKSIFKDNQEIVIDKQVTLTGDSMKKTVIDSNNNGYVKVKHFGNVTTIELIDILTSIAREADASKLPDTAFMNHRNKGANAVLRAKTGGIVEANIIKIFDTESQERKDAIKKSHYEQRESIERGGGVLEHWAKTQ